jgi:stage II sporulation protein AA (anti-sigma F factor antagonist)
MLEIKLSTKGNTLIAAIIGELDHHSAEYVRRKLDRELLKSANKNIIFDFSKLTFMDSSGIGVVMGRYKLIQNINGRVAISNAQNTIKKLLEMSGILKFIPIYDNIDLAFRAIINLEGENVYHAAANK